MKNINKNYFQLFIFICLVLPGCHKKNKVEPDDRAWTYFADGSFEHATIYKNELFLLGSDGLALYRVRSDGRLIETRAIVYNSYYPSMLYNNCYLSSYPIPQPNSSNDSINFYINSLTDPSDRILLKNLNTNDSTFVTYAKFSIPLDTLTHPGILVNQYRDYVTTDNNLHWKFVTIKPSVGQNSSNIESVNYTGKFDSIFKTSGYYSYTQHVFGFKGSYIFTSEQNPNTGYILNANSVLEKIDNMYIPHFVYRDTLYSIDYYSPKLYRSVDGKNWTYAKSHPNPYGSFGKMFVIKDMLIDVSTLSEYDLYSNSFRKLNNDGLIYQGANSLVEFNGYVYASQNSKIYRKKIEYFFDTK